MDSHKFGADPTYVLVLRNVWLFPFDGGINQLTGKAVSMRFLWQRGYVSRYYILVGAVANKFNANVWKIVIFILFEASRQIL